MAHSSSLVPYHSHIFNMSDMHYGNLAIQCSVGQIDRYIDPRKFCDPYYYLYNNIIIATDPSLIPSSFSQHHADSSQHHSNSSQYHPNSSQQSLSLSQHCHSVSRCSPEPGPAKTSPNPINLPSSPEPYRQSVLSIKVPPDSNTANQKRSASTLKEKSVASAPVLKWNFDDKQELSGQNAPKIGTTTDPWSDENYWKNCDDGNRSPYFWERTFMNEPEEGVKKEQDSNCKTQ